MRIGITDSVLAQYTKVSLTSLINQYRYLLIVDVEHTCTSDDSIPSSEKEIIEIGAVVVSGQNLQILDQFERLVRPVQHPVLSDFCTELTGIQQADVDAADNFSDVFEEFKSWLSGYDTYLFASWGSYDIVQIGLDCEYHNIDPLLLSATLNLKKAFAKAQKIKPQVGMKRAMQLAGITTEGSHHRGLDDARNIARLLPFALGAKDISPP